MIIILDILLLLNLYIAYRYFDNIFAPPVLMGVGLLLASLIATSYYDEWRLHDMLLETVFIQGFSAILFTSSCIFFYGRNKRMKFYTFSNGRRIEFKKRSVVAYLILVSLLTWICAYQKMFTYGSIWGTIYTYSELIGKARHDGWNGENLLEFPRYIMWLSNVVFISSFITSWILAIRLICRRKLDVIILLSIVHLLGVVTNGFISGTKGGFIDPIFHFLVIYFFCLGSYCRTFHLSTKKLVLISILLLVSLSSFRTINLLIGRNDTMDNSNLIAEYFGAEIKNFDIYMHGKDPNSRNKLWGEETFGNLYAEFTKYQRSPRLGNNVGNFELGNVYTQTYSFHKDFGYIGTFFLTVFIAFLSTGAYRKAITSDNTKKINIFLFAYSCMAMNLFMSFFSSRFSEEIFRYGFIKLMIYLWLSILLFEKFLLTKHNSFIAK